jgi:hypothetical protein
MLTEQILRWAIVITRDGKERFAPMLDDQWPGHWQTFYVTLFDDRGLAEARLRQLREQKPHMCSGARVVPVAVEIKELSP